MKREFLVGLGIDAEVVNQIMAVHGSEVNGLNEEIETLKKTETTLNKRLKGLEEDLEALKGDDTETLKNEIETLKNEHADEIAKLQRSHKLEHLLISSGVNEDAREFVEFKLNSLEFADGELKGADEAISALKESNPSLFVQQAVEPTTTNKPTWSQGGVSTTTGGTRTRDEIMAISDTVERQKAIQENMHLFN